ncbi:MAG TPA: hypothetical protein VK171_16465 [Fimbriimonas sp.]|nr:hypothetical protein [Fimbriimonas sp.]
MDSSHFWYLEDIIDFAGTFPPAALDAATTLAEYQSKCEVPIVGNLAWKCADLALITESNLPQDSVIEVAAIGRPRPDAQTWKAVFQQDMADLQAFVDETPNGAIATYECRTTGIEDIASQLGMLKPISKGVDVYLEVPWDHPLEPLLSAIAEQEGIRPKLRTGGLSAGDYPSAEALATFITQCVDLELEFKLTAGLHSPISHVDDGVLSFGFLNVLFATGIAYRDDATVSEVVKVLTATDHSEWRAKESLAFRGDELDSDDLDSARSFFGSFGCCSIDDPLTGMQALLKETNQ